MDWPLFVMTDRRRLSHVARCLMCLDPKIELGLQDMRINEIGTTLRTSTSSWSTKYDGDGTELQTASIGYVAK